MSHILLPVLMALATVSASADDACEKKIAATGQVFKQSDPKAICDQGPSAATQSCIVELLTKGKGKLRNLDLMSIVGICTVDPSKEVRDCFVSKLAPAWNDPAYKPAEKIGDECFMARKRFAKTGLKTGKALSSKTPAQAKATPAPASSEKKQ
jgi:hypothetical protein